jgi:hypothetical protein
MKIIHSKPLYDVIEPGFEFLVSGIYACVYTTNTSEGITIAMFNEKTKKSLMEKINQQLQRDKTTEVVSVYKNFEPIPFQLTKTFHTYIDDLLENRKFIN